MAANTSGYSKSQPSGSSSIRDGDDLLRSDKSVLEAALNDEHFFTPQTSASSASGGVHRPGSARVFFGARSGLGNGASADSAGRLYYSTDLGSLHYIAASSHSTIVGGTEPVGARAEGPSATVGSGGGGAAVTWTTEAYDVGAMYTATASVITSTESGRYMVSGYLSYTDSVHTGTLREIWITVGGTIVARASSDTHPGSTRPISLHACTVVQAPTATAFVMNTFHDAGVNLGASNMTGSLSVQKIV